MLYTGSASGALKPAQLLPPPPSPPPPLAANRPLPGRRSAASSLAQGDGLLLLGWVLPGWPPAPAGLKLSPTMAPVMLESSSCHESDSNRSGSCRLHRLKLVLAAPGVGGALPSCSVDRMPQARKPSGLAPAPGRWVVSTTSD